MKIRYYILSVLLACLTFFACKQDTKAPTKDKEKAAKEIVRIPSFNSDSAYHFIAKQVEFGPRVPGTPEHQACKEWLVNKFEAYGAEVIEQDFVANIYTGDRWNSTNIIAQFNRSNKNRLVLSAHWDTRMMAEEDADEARKKEAILGADDGGSGVGVLLEVARLLNEHPIDYGVDIVLFDAEDQGERGSNSPIEHWCLGAQHWSKNLHVHKHKAQFGILLDMVGAKNPRFGKDQFSKQYAGKIQEKVWSLAQNMGYSDAFVNDDTGYVTDDHYFVNTIARIPMIDIINQPPNSETSFGSHWHTHDDNLDIINKRTLKTVGQVVTAVVYRKNNGQF